MGDYITTYTGKHFEPSNPDPEMIRIEDIAHALSLICRGNGHVKTFWSVGQHCINCAEAGVTQKYYAFRSMTYLRMAEEWCREHKVRYFRKDGKN